MFKYRSIISNIIIIIVAVFVIKVSSHDAGIHTYKYTINNFNDEIPKRNHFVMFYAPWCGHCQRLAPTWEQLAEMLNEDHNNIRIAKIDCTTDSSVCSDHDVTGYPTLKFFKRGSKDGVKFRGTRDLPTLTTFINEQLREGDEQDAAESVNHYQHTKPPQPLSKLIELNRDNIEGYLKKPKMFVKFYAPWCGHCQKLAPTWEELARSLEYENSIVVAKVDCTQFSSICTQFEVKRYPTLLWIEYGKQIEIYQDERTHEGLKAFVNKMLARKSKTGEPEKPLQGSHDSVGVLNGNTFKHGIAKGVTFVKFFAPWCGHCKRLAPLWDDLGKKFIADGNVNIVKVDCTLDDNKDLCNEQEIEGFPTMFLYKNGAKISEYTGSRSLVDLYDFVKKHAVHDEL